MNIIGNTENCQYLSLVHAGSSCNCSVCQEIDQVQSQKLVLKPGQQSVDEIELEIRLKHLKSAKNRTHSLINQKLPPEIISIIFAHCAPSANQLEYRFESWYRGSMINPLQLGRICNYWRAIAWSTPGLWSQPFFVVLSNQIGERGSLLADLAREWLDRSGNLPLSLYIQMDEKDDFYDVVQPLLIPAHPVLEVVTQYTHRWRDLYMKTWTSCMPPMPSDVKQIPILRSFTFLPLGCMEPSWLDFQITPRRVTFDLGDLMGPEYGLRCFENISWVHLTDITVSFFSRNEHVQILKSAPQLTKLAIIDFIPDPSIFVEFDQVVHPKLQSFTILAHFGGIDASSYDVLLSVLNFPSLTEFIYDAGHPLQLADPSGFQSHGRTDFFGRLQHLRSLTIRLSLSLEGEKYTHILKGLPTLENLVLIDWDGGYDFGGPESTTHLRPNPLLSLLAATYNNQVASQIESSQPFLPVLRTFGYQARFQEPPWAAILSVVGPLSDIGNSRRRRPLGTIVIDLVYRLEKLDAALVCRIAEVKEAGVDVILMGNFPTMESK